MQISWMLEHDVTIHFFLAYTIYDHIKMDKNVKEKLQSSCMIIFDNVNFCQTLIVRRKMASVTLF